MKSHLGGMILLDGYLYGCNDPGILTCLKYETGQVMWTDRSSGRCSLLYADGMLYARSERGPISLVEASPEGFRLKGRFGQPIRSNKKSWPHPIIANGRLFLRDQDVLLCYDVRAKGK
jgi:outer membrane protein assembly factor BamB